MERATSESHGKREDISISHETMSTSSEGKYSQTSKGRSPHDFSLSPFLHQHRKRAKSLKNSLRKANIDCPDSCNPYSVRLPLSPLPEPVEEDASEDSYEGTRKKNHNLSYDAYIRKQRDFVEDMFQLQKRSIADYIQESVNEPLDLGSVKETEEENTSKESKRIYSLHDLSKYLKKMRFRSDLFEEEEMAMPNISAQGEVGVGIKEIDSEYEESSEGEKSSTSGMSLASGRAVFMDKAEPLEGLSDEGGKKHHLNSVPDTIQEEAGDSEVLGEHPTLFNQLQKNHAEVDFVAKLLKKDKYSGRELPPRVRSSSFDTEDQIQEEPGELGTNHQQT